MEKVRLVTWYPETSTNELKAMRAKAFKDMKEVGIFNPVITAVPSMSSIVLSENPLTDNEAFEIHVTLNESRDLNDPDPNEVVVDWEPSPHFTET